MITLSGIRPKEGNRVMNLLMFRCNFCSTLENFARSSDFSGVTEAYSVRRLVIRLITCTLFFSSITKFSAQLIVIASFEYSDELTTLRKISKFILFKFLVNWYYFQNSSSTLDFFLPLYCDITSDELLYIRCKSITLAVSVGYLIIPAVPSS